LDARAEMRARLEIKHEAHAKILRGGIAGDYAFGGERGDIRVPD
jgi:hypothetical protein